MASFGVRKHQRLKELIPVLYGSEGSVGEGLIQDLSLNGSYIMGNRPVPLGGSLTLQLFVPGDPRPLIIDRVMVKWVEGLAFGVDFGTLNAKIADRITTTIATLVTAQHGVFRKEHVHIESRPR
jgi:hypothetical protein